MGPPLQVSLLTECFCQFPSMAKKTKSNSDKKFLLNLDLLVRGVLQLLDWLLFIGTSGPPRKQNSYLISFCIENTILQFIISTTFFLVFLSFFLLTITHPCLCFTVLRSVCHVVSDQSTVADTSSSDIILTTSSA